MHHLALGNVANHIVAVNFIEIPPLPQHCHHSAIFQPANVGAAVIGSVVDDGCQRGLSCILLGKGKIMAVEKMAQSEGLLATIRFGTRGEYKYKNFALPGSVDKGFISIED